MVYDAGPPVKVICTSTARRETAGISGEAMQRVARAERMRVVVYIFATFRWMKLDVNGACLKWIKRKRLMRLMCMYEYEIEMYEYEIGSDPVLYMYFLPFVLRGRDTS